MPAEGPGRADAPAPTRVLFVINDLARAGAETQLVELALALDPARYERRIVLLKERNDFADALGAAGIEVVPLRRAGAWDTAVLFRLWREVRRFRPHVLHSFLFLANAISAVAGRLVGVPWIVLSQRCSYQSTLPGPWRGVARLSHRLADRVVLNSRAALAEEVAAGFPEPRLVYVPNAVRRMAPDPGGPAVVSGGGPIVLSIGQLEPIKGHEHLLRAWPAVREAHPGARLVLVGDGTARDPLETLASRLGIAGSVVFAGFRSPVEPFLAACDVLVQPSLTEGSPNAVLEAMAAGRPVVATGVGGVPDVVADGETGRLVPPGDAPAIARAVIGLLGDAPLRTRMGSAGAARARSRFSIERLRDAMEAVYTSRAPAP